MPRGAVQPLGRVYAVKKNTRRGTKKHVPLPCRGGCVKHEQKMYITNISNYIAKHSDIIIFRTLIIRFINIVVINIDISNICDGFDITNITNCNCILNINNCIGITHK